MASYDSFKKLPADAFIAATVSTTDIADSAVIAGKFVAGAITTAKIAAGSVGADELTTSVDLSGKTVTYRAITDSDISATANISAVKLAAGAAVANLGYTPLRQDGGNTMTGPLAIASNLSTASGAAVRRTGEAGTGLFVPAANNVAFSIANTEAMRLNSSGHKTAGSSQSSGSLMWHSAGTSGWTYANSYGGYGWREIGAGFGWDGYQRGGSNFNYSNGRMTAPVSGFYHLGWQSYNYNDDNNTPNYIHLSWSRNGATGPWTGRTPHGIWMHGTSANHAGGVTMNLDLYLNATEYTSMLFYWAGGPSRVHGTHSIFNGYLIG